LLALAPFATSRLVRSKDPSGGRPRGLAPALASVPALLAVALLVSPARAHSGGGAKPPIEVPQPPPGDGATAFTLLRDIDAKAKAPRVQKLVADPVRRAKKALERAHGARASGDTAHAKMLDGVALEWAETARDLIRAADAEQAATQVAAAAKEAAGKAERARALLEETQARRGRAEAELERLEAQARTSSEAAAKAEEARIAEGKNKKKGGDAAGKPAKGAGKPAGKGTKK
jgi:colicin import membrane protein